MKNVPSSVLWIRKGKTVYKRVEGSEYFEHNQTFPTINAAKRVTRVMPLGTIRRYESLKAEGYSVRLP